MKEETLCKPALFIFGCRSTAVEIHAVAKALFPGRQVRMVRARAEEAAHSVSREDDEISSLSEDDVRAHLDAHPSVSHRFIISMTRRDYRERWLVLAKEWGLQPESILHPLAVVADGARVGPGCYLAAHAVVSNNASLAAHGVVNYHAVIGHDARLEEHVIVHPGASIGGGASLGPGVLIGANAFVAPGIAIGANSSVDALTYVDRDLPPSTILSGRTSRARMVQKRDQTPGGTPPSLSPWSDGENGNGNGRSPAMKADSGREAFEKGLLGAINQVRAHGNRPPVERIDLQTRLREDLGMDSLALAELAVHLEAMWGIDVFAAGIGGTVGEMALHVPGWREALEPEQITRDR